MSSLKDFKGIADDIMSEINAEDELKKKILMECTKKRQVRLSKFLIPAACFILVLGLVNLYGLQPLKNQTGQERIPENRILTDSDDGTQTLPDNNSIPDPGAIKTWPLKMPEEAKRNFGDSYLAPTYIPQKFKFSEMHAQGTQDDLATKILLSYVSGDQSFMIIEEKTTLKSGFTNYKTVDINGATGYIKPNISGNGESGANLDTELHWFAGDVHYSVMGLITENEAVKVARSMK